MSNAAIVSLVGDEQCLPIALILLRINATVSRVRVTLYILVICGTGCTIIIRPAKISGGLRYDNC